MRSLRFGDLHAHYLESGAGEPLLLLHAGASSSRQWAKVGKALSGQYRLVAPDLIGFGRTDAWGGPDELTHDDQARLLSTILDDVCAERRVHVMGHSYGGATAVRLLLQAPEAIRSLVLIESILVGLLREAGEAALFDDYRGFAERFIRDGQTGQEEAAWQTFIDHRNGPGTWGAMQVESRARLIAITAQTASAFRSNLSNPTTLADCAGIAVPTLVICGEDTTAAERRITEILRDTVPGCVHTLVPGAEHMSPLTHPGDIAALVQGHIARAGASA